MRKKAFKKLACFTLAGVMVLGTGVSAVAADKDSSDAELRAAYSRVMSYAEENGIELGTTYEDFLSDYNGQGAVEYEQAYYQVLVPQNAMTYSSSSGGGSKYYYNTGTTCPSQANYSKYNLLDVVKKGDVIYEANGGFGVTGHIAIVENIFTRPDGRKYIRLIEAIQNSDGGVTRSILDDTRADEKAVTVLRVKGATEKIIYNAVHFCVLELGSAYYLDVGAKDTSHDETDWYCSELVWAAYKNQGIDIEVGGLHGEPGVTPHDILDSDLTYKVAYSKK